MTRIRWGKDNFRIKGRGHIKLFQQLEKNENKIELLSSSKTLVRISVHNYQFANQRIHSNSDHICINSKPNNDICSPLIVHKIINIRISDGYLYIFWLSQKVISENYWVFFLFILFIKFLLLLALLQPVDPPRDLITQIRQCTPPAGAVIILALGPEKVASGFLADSHLSQVDYW